MIPSKARRRRDPWTPGRQPMRHLGRRCAIASALVGAAFTIASAQQPTIRTSTDVFRLEVTVVDRDGNPIQGLRPDQFEVAIAGRKRVVALADMVRANATAAAVGDAPAATTAATSEPAPVDPGATARSVMIAVDAQSFPPAEVRGFAQAADGFIEALPSTDRVGVHTFPIGPSLEPTADHTMAIDALSRVTGQQVSDGACPIRNADLVDWYAASQAERLAIARRYQSACPSIPNIDVEIENRIGMKEAQALALLATLRDFVTMMGQWPGRKVLVLLSRGFPTADRPGGRPDVADLPQELGELAARNDVLVYSVLVDDTMREEVSAERRQLVSGPNRARDGDLSARWLDRFTGAAGGLLSRVMTGNGEVVFGRILREMSATYLLAVDVAPSDRTGRPLRVTVKVNQPGVTVRFRPWVVVPAAAPAAGSH
jgi:VWFA-related protein